MQDRELISEYLFVVNFVLEDPSAILQDPHLSAGNSENLEVHIPGHSSSDLLRGGVSLVDLYHVLGRGGNYEDLIKELKENDAWKNPDKIVVAKLRVERPDGRSFCACFLLSSPIHCEHRAKRSIYYSNETGL